MKFDNEFVPSMLLNEKKEDGSYRKGTRMTDAEMELQLSTVTDKRTLADLQQELENELRTRKQQVTRVWSLRPHRQAIIK